MDTTHSRTLSLDDSPSGDAPESIVPEKLYPQNADQNPEPASSKEVLHDAPEVVEAWLSDTSRRPTSPFSIDDTVVSGFPPPPPEFDEKNESVSRRATEDPIEKPKTCGLPRRYFLGLIILIWVVLLGIGLGVGLGVGLNKDKPKPAVNVVEPYCAENPEYCVGGTLGSLYYTTNGTFNGTGIALATEFWNHQERKIMTVYFQHWTGDIRSIQLTPKGEWIGGSKSEVIVTDAKNATPISTVSYATNGTAQWHLFYLDTNNVVRQKVNSNSTNIWQDGPLNDLNLTAYDAPNVGLQACWYGNYYGDTDASDFPTYTGENNTVPFNSHTQGMHLWYPTNESTFSQWGWYEGQAQWVEQHTWPQMNTHAGVGCYSWGPSSTTYAMMVNQDNTAEVWWKDTNDNMTSTKEHPINEWVNTTDCAINNVYPSTSLGYTDYFYAQQPDGSVRGHFVNWASENTTTVEENSFTVGGARGAVMALKGGHMSVTAVDDQSGGTSLYVFYQTRGDDLSVFTRDYKGGQWTQGELPIPDN